MRDLCKLIWCAVAGLFRSRAALQGEILVLRHQLNALRRKSPTVSFRLLYGLLILQHARRELLWVGVTAHPSAQWVAQQLTEVYGCEETPRYLIRRPGFCPMVRSSCGVL